MGVALNDEADSCEFVYRVRALDRVGRAPISANFF